MRATTLLRHLICVQGLLVLRVVLERQGLVVDVRPSRSKPRCSSCGALATRIHDRRERRWRHQDALGLMVHLRYRIARVHCQSCEAVKTEAVSWAEPGSNFTHAFEERIAYLAQQSSRTAVTKLMRTTWRTVGRIIRRVVGAKLDAGPDRLTDLRHIGIDELSYRKHHKYVTVVVDHDTGRIVWAAEGKNAATLGRFFEDLGEKRRDLLESITIDMSAAYIKAVREHAPAARLIFDRFHVQRLVQDAMDGTRRDEMRGVSKELRRALKGTRWALQKGPWNLNASESATLEQLEELNKPIFRGYLLKERLAAILDGRQVNVARSRLNQWIIEAMASGLAHFERAARTIAQHLDGILEYVRTRRNNGRVEGLNGKARTITRRSYGFHSAAALISMLFLCCGGVNVTPGFATLSPTH